MLVFGALLAGGYWLVQRRSVELCSVCGRQVKPEAHAIVEIGGRRRNVCCVRCALTEGRQENKPVRFIEVNDYRTGKELNPRRAWYVDGTRIVACAHGKVRIDEMKQTEEMSFDRCSPSIFAFADRKSAEAFATENGGVVRDPTELLKEVQR